MKPALSLLLLALCCAAAEARRPAGSPMALIPGGAFVMGSAPGQGQADEHPAHKVRLKPFYMDKYEVTVAQYRAFAGKNMPQQPDWSTDNHPVLGVSWVQAAKYCHSQRKRLPTEAEWEKAARGGSAKKYFFGDDASKLGAYCWYRDNSSDIPHDVGLLKPNAYGLYDTCGNAFEWTADVYDENYYAESPALNPQGPDNPLADKIKPKPLAAAAPQKTIVRKLKLRGQQEPDAEKPAEAKPVPDEAPAPSRQKQPPPNPDDLPEAVGMSLPGAPPGAEHMSPAAIAQLNASFDGGQSISESIVFPSKRGGSWLAGPDMLRSAARSGDEQSGGGMDIGFRCAK